MPTSLRAWLQLFRVPNLLTVPGDPLAGFLIATGGRLDGRVGPAIVSSLCLYAAGLAMNDLADLAEDRRERPRRPLASGAIGKSAAIYATIALIVCGLGVLGTEPGQAAAMVGTLLLGAVAFYNFLTKRIPFLGAVNMGLCRALSISLGAAAALGPDVPMVASAGLVSALHPMLVAPMLLFASERGQMLFTFAAIGGGLVGLYIAAVTNLARHETRPDYPKLARVLPLGSLLLGYVVLKQATGTLLRDQSPTLWLLAIILCAMNTGELMRVPPPPLPPRIGGYIRILPILQASLCLVPSVLGPLGKTPASFLVALCLLACVPLHAWLGKKFYAS